MVEGPHQQCYTFVWYPSASFPGYAILTGASLTEALATFDRSHDLPKLDTYLAITHPDVILRSPGGVIIASTDAPHHPDETDFL